MKRKSILKALLLTVLMCCLTFALVACGGKHTVTFNYGVDGNGDGEVDVVTVEVGDGSLLEEPTDVPTREGYTFVGWGTDEGMWNFAEDTVTADITLNARWAAGEAVDPGTPGTTVYVNYALGDGAADSASEPARWSGAPGTTIKLPAAPAAGAGWEFTGWLVSGETELRTPESDYTVNGTVTITAQWKSIEYAQYTWTVTTQPSDSTAGVATGTPVGVGDRITVDLPAFPADESGYADVPTAGMYNVETADATCTESATETLYYTIPQTQTYESYKLLIDVQSLPGEPATGHLYTTWIVTNPSATATGTATATCANGCGKTLTITLPAITGNTGAGEGKYSETVQQPLSCEQDGIIDYVYTIPASDLADGDAEDAAAGTVKELSFTVTTPATGHEMVISVRLSNATDTNIVTTATLQATCAHDNCDQEWDTQPVEATVTFDLGSGNVQNGVTLAKEAVTFDEEKKQFTVTLPDEDAMTLTGGTIFTGWKVGDTDAGSTISVAADGTVAVTGNFTKHTHNYGEVTFVPSGDYAGKFVATCGEGGCPEPTVVVAATDGTFNPVLKDGTSVAINHTLSADDFTVQIVYKYQIAWEEHDVGDPYLTITLGDAEDETYQSYFSNNLDTLSTEAWANGLQATFEFKVDSKTIASGTATFDVVPAADDIFGTGTDVQILYNKAGEIARSTEIGALSGAASGMSVSFWLNEQATSDWDADAIACGTNDRLIISLPNLDWNLNEDNISGVNANPGAHGTLHNGAAWNVFLEQYSYVTITVTTSSVIYYKNGVKVVEYSNTDTQQAQDEQIQAFITALLADIAKNGFKFGVGINTKDLLITTDLVDTQAGAIYEWYSAEYPLTTGGNFVVGNENCVMSFTGTAPVWTGGPVAKGEKIVISGTLRSKGSNGWEVPVINLYSGVGIGKTAFRSDGFVINDTAGAETSWSVAVTPAISGADSNYVGDGAAASTADTAFLTAIQTGVTYTLTYDWTDESKIVVTAVFASGSDMTRTSTFTITAAAEQTLAESYNIGIGGENIYLQMTSVTRS